MVADRLADQDSHVRTDPPRERGGSFSLIEKILASVTAAFVLVSTVLGILFKQSSDARDNLDGTLASERAANETLKRQVEDLQARNSSLTKELSARGVSTEAPTGNVDVDPPSTTNGSTVKTSAVALDSGDWADLARGITGHGNSPPDYIDLSFASTDNYLVLAGSSSSGRVWFARVPTNPTFETCRSALDSRRENNVTLSPTPTAPQIGQGAWFCFEYGPAQVAALQVKQFTLMPKHVVLSYTLWRR
jgi:cell division protein FtsL